MVARYEGERVPEIHFLHLKVSLDDDPWTWRRLRVINRLTLRALHDVIQASFGWDRSELHGMIIGTKIYGPRCGGPPLLRDERRARLGQLVKPGRVFEYLHRGRRHIVEVEGWSAILPGDAPVTCVAGANGDGRTLFDARRVNLVFAAWQERPPASMLN